MFYIVSFIEGHPEPSRSYSAKSASIMLRNGPNRGLTSQMVLKTQKFQT